ncbi:hypothetical protein WME99_25640 [Sorangium sp. So ce136]|uniref:hypothetical protein n=1 Tax=Sorangium sp. So ce136 TaxID=3133284 RepID=UPI003F0E2C6A
MMGALDGLGERVIGVLAAMSASRRTGSARQVVLIAHSSESIAADFAWIPGVRTVNDVVVAGVPAAFAARMLDVCFAWRGDEVREADAARALVVHVSDEEAVIVYLDEVLGGAEQLTKAREEEFAMGAKAELGSQAGTAEPAPQRLKQASSKKKPKRKRAPRPLDGLYGGHTRVAAKDSKEQIERLLDEHGCTAKSIGDEAGIARVDFRFNSRQIRFAFKIPSPEEFRYISGGRRELTDDQARALAQQALRQRWRAMFLGIKGKLVLVQSGVSSMENVFLAETVDPASGRTVAELIQQKRILPALGPATAPVLDAEFVEGAHFGVPALDGPSSTGAMA